MKKTKTKLVLAVLFSAISTEVSAQKLPNVQKAGVRAPVDIKIDGQLSERNDKFQAYNKSTELYYTVSNDDDNLYLIVQATNPRIIQKIFGGAITFTINGSGKKKDANATSVTFPLMSSQNGAGVLSAVKKEASASDPSMPITNKMLADHAKEIKITGMPSVTDTIAGITDQKKEYFRYFPLYHHPGKYIPVNNQYSINAIAAFDTKGTFTYEIAIPLKCLGLSVNDQQKFLYDVKLNGRLDDTGRPAPGATITYKYRNDMAYDVDQDLDASTDFWGEYTLTKN